MFIIDGIEEKTTETLSLVKNIDAYINKTVAEIKRALPDPNSREQVDLMFFEFYTKNSHLSDNPDISRKTEYAYLSRLLK